jgi:hypothetical protein
MHAKQLVSRIDKECRERTAYRKHENPPMITLGCFGSLSIIQIPFDAELAVAIHMHMPRRVIAFPPNKKQSRFSWCYRQG